MRALVVTSLVSISLLFLSGGRAAEADPELTLAEKTLQEAKQATDGPALVKFFQERTLSDADRKKLGDLVRQLGDEEFEVRQKAYKSLHTAGGAARAFLEAALKDRDPDPQVVRSVKSLLKELDSGSDRVLVLAAARVVAARKPARATRTLLAYLPVAGDEAVQEAVFNALGEVGVKGGKVNPVLTAALGDKEPLRRMAAAFVHGRKALEYRKILSPLLKDADARVRFQVASALVLVGDRPAVDTLLALLSETPDAVSGVFWEAESMLFRIAGDKPPQISAGSTDAERKEYRKAWTKWWDENKAKVDLAKVDFKGGLLGLNLVCDVDTGVGSGGKLWEFGKDGKERWNYTGIRVIVDVDLLPKGRMLIAEGANYQVTERDRSGKIFRTIRTNGYATTVKRLPNGNIFLSGYGEIQEVTPKGKVVFSYKATGGSIYRVRRLRNGNLLFPSNGRVMEIDKTGKQIRSIAIPGGTGIWADVEPLPNGRYLVAQYSSNKVTELDADGKVHWEVAVKTPSSVSRLPNGNVLVSAMDARYVVEFNRAKKEVWKMKTVGRPFLVRRY